LLGGRWPPVNGALTFKPQLEGNSFYYPQKLTSDELKALIQPSLADRAASRAVSKTLTELTSALPALATAALSAVEVLTTVAMDSAIAQSGKAALAQAQARPGTAFFVTVVYTAKSKTAGAPVGMQIAASSQKDLTGVQAYIYWIH
jgi:hypothetical protein